MGVVEWYLIIVMSGGSPIIPVPYQTAEDCQKAGKSIQYHRGGASGVENEEFLCVPGPNMANQPTK